MIALSAVAVDQRLLRLGTAICRHGFDQGGLSRINGARAVAIKPKRARGVREGVRGRRSRLISERRSAVAAEATSGHSGH